MAYSRHRISHKKEVYYILCIVVLIVILSFSLFGPNGYRDLRKKRADLQEMKTRVEALKSENSERKKTIEELRSDREAWERHARERGYGKEGEIIQHLPE
jgi:cell division protein FtsB